MNQIIEIESIGVKYNLNKHKEAVAFFLYLLSEDNFSINTGSIIQHSQGLDLSEYIANLINSENPYLRCQSDVGELLKIYSNANNNINVLYQYVMDENIGDKMKEQKLQNILKALATYISWLWEYDCVSTACYHFKKGISEFNQKLKTNPELYAFLPSYFIYMNLKSVYDLLWDKFPLFINVDKNEFQYTFSHNEDIESVDVISAQNLIVESKRTREQIFKELMDGETKIMLFHKYEEKLIQYNYLNKEKNKWRQLASNFLRFYCYCEDNKLFKYYRSENTNGVKLLRELYHFNDGTTMDKRSKRIKQLTPKKKYEFSFLDNIK